jgi:tetratricopeptide (TPR) repeat protein
MPTRFLVFLGLVARLAGPGMLHAQGAEDHAALGVGAMRTPDLDTGLAEFEAALALDSTSYQADWRASIAILDRIEMAADSLTRPERDSLYARAEMLARRAVAADSADANGHFALALALGRASLTMDRQKRIRLASVIRNEARKAIALDPRHDGAYHILGRWNAEIMRLSGFSRFFARSFLGADVFAQASWDSAIANLEAAVALDPARIYHRLDLARVYADRRRYDDARAQLQRVAELPDREILDPRYRREAAALFAALEAKD